MRVFAVLWESNNSGPCIWRELEDALTEIRELFADADQIGYVGKVSIEEREMPEAEVDALPEFPGY